MKLIDLKVKNEINPIKIENVKVKHCLIDQEILQFS